MSETKRPICLTCPFWSEATYDDGSRDETPEDRVGTCRRHAPRAAMDRVIKEQDHEDFPTWPTTIGIEWCGEHPGFVAHLQEWRKAQARESN